MSMPETDRNLSTTKRALLALKHLQDKIDALERAKHEPIAMIGTSCRFPGGVDTPDAFWTLMQQKTDAIAEVPSDRWSIDAYYSTDPDTPGKMVSRYGGFIPHLYDFDAPFFRISPREALTLDPQQRLLLELSWEALESAGIAPDAMANRSVGVFAGISSIDHWQRVLARSRQTIDPYLTTGNTHSVAAGRVSFLLGVSGPSLAVDTACSSSLVAIHLACQSLRQQECDLALAGGVNRIITPDASINFTKARMLSADGRCRTFDAKASGFGRAEGGGMIVLKRLSDAQADGDRIEAVILGSAVNHDGRTSGLTAPNGSAQQAVIRQALNASRIDPAAVSYLETHGTGTALGDPIEVGALGEVFGETRTSDTFVPNTLRERPLVLGAVKTNIGHLEAAAGMAGTIKAALALQHRCIPANLHLNVPNPHIDWDALPFKVPTTALPWFSGDGSRVAGVSAFGFNGTNAHLILGEPPSPPTRRPSSSSPSPTPYLLPLSARTPAALNQLAARYAQHIAARPDLNLADLCFTTSVGRSHFAHRLAIVASSTPELRKILVDVLSGRANPACWRSHHSTGGESNSAPGFLENLAQRYVQGESIHWTDLYQQEDCHKIVLPTYPFQRQHYSIDSVPSI